MARRAPADDYNWCVVPHRPWDTLLFAGIAVVVACLSQGPYSSLIVLIAGESLLQSHFLLHLIVPVAGEDCIKCHCSKHITVSG